MNYKIRSIGAALRSSWRYAVLAAVAPALLLTGGQAAAREGVRLLQTLTLPGGQQIQSFDIGFVDTTLGIYLLADRTNATVNVYDTSSNQLINQVSSAASPFAGAKSSNDISGPDGVLTVAHSQIWAGDGDSTIKVFDVFSGGLIKVINTGGTMRADELCYDPADELVMMANDADDPPFVTIIDAKAGSPTRYTILATIKMDGKVGPKATNGIEQCQYTSGRFYVNLPEVNGPGDNSVPGAVVVVNPTTQKITAVATIAPVANCSGPQGMVVGPPDDTIAGATDILLGCNHSSSTVVIAVEGDGVAIRNVNFWEGGADEVDYNAADNSYYLAESSPTSFTTQRLGSIDADTLTNDISVRTGIKSGVGGVTHGSNHSVAADPVNNQVYVPIAATSGSTYCPTSAGCIAVFRSQAP